MSATQVETKDEIIYTTNQIGKFTKSYNTAQLKYVNEKMTLFTPRVDRISDKIIFEKLGFGDFDITEVFTSTNGGPVTFQRLSIRSSISNIVVNDKDKENRIEEIELQNNVLVGVLDDLISTPEKEIECAAKILARLDEKKESGDDEFKTRMINENAGFVFISSTPKLRIEYDYSLSGTVASINIFEVTE